MCISANSNQGSDRQTADITWFINVMNNFLVIRSREIRFERNQLSLLFATQIRRVVIEKYKSNKYPLSRFP